MSDRIYPEQDLTEKIIGAGIEVHRALGPGLLESIYQACLAHEFALHVHKAQLLTYLKITGCKVGLLMNFNSAVLKNGIERLVL